MEAARGSRLEQSVCTWSGREIAVYDAEIDGAFLTAGSVLLQIICGKRKTLKIYLSLLFPSDSQR
ncbi:hypothetical protein PSSHI_17420 [Photobacterium sp. R1]